MKKVNAKWRKILHVHYMKMFKDEGKCGIYKRALLFVFEYVTKTGTRDVHFRAVEGVNFEFIETL